MFTIAMQTKRQFSVINSGMAGLLIFSLLLAPATVWPAARQPSVDALQRQVAALQGRVATLEQQLSKVLQLVSKQSAANKAAVQPAAAESRPVAVINPPADSRIVRSIGNSAINIGGRLKIDAIYNSRSTGGNSGSNGGDVAFLPAAIPLTGNGETNQLSFDARETRLWVKSYSPSDYGEMAGYVEVDFSSASSASNEKASNAFIPRLRHAYGTLGGFTLGQTYTTFMNVSAFPEINDLNGPVGIMNIRQPLFRYEYHRGRGKLFVAVENPETTLVTTAGSRIAPDDDRLPDMIGKVEFTGDWGNWSLAGMLREIRSDGAVVAGVADSAWGGAVSASGRIRLAGQDNLRFNLAYGNALGRYLSYNAFDDGIIDSNGRINLNRVSGGYIVYQHWWTDTLRSNAGVGFGHADYSATLAPGSANKNFYSTNLNLIWSPSLNSSIGLEWLHGFRELEDGREGQLDRLQLTSMYKF